jgi:ComF family protein
MNLIYRYIKDFTGLIFPQLCQACGTSLVQYEKLICITCLYKLPYTNYHLDKENKLAKQFWGKIPLESCVAMLYFIKKGRVQNLMHQLKYNNQPEIGKELGRQYGLILKKSDIYYQIDGIIPVPLHPNRLKQRGYNQSEQFANGLAEILEVPVYNQILYRSKPSDSQIKMSRNLRFENMKTAFKATSLDIPLRNILLVDDTITTGATLEACCIALNNIGITKIHIAGIAFTA